VCIDFHETGSVGEGIDHLQLIKFWPSCARGKGSTTGRTFLAPRYYAKRAMFASLRALFSLALLHSTGQLRTERDGDTEKGCQNLFYSRRLLMMAADSVVVNVCSAC